MSLPYSPLTAMQACYPAFSEVLVDSVMPFGTLGSFRKPQRQLQREHRESLNRDTMGVHLRYNSWYIFFAVRYKTSQLSMK